MKILLSAYSCHPNKGSEPGVGWNWLKELSKDNEVWVFIYAGQDQKETVAEAVTMLPYSDNVHIVPISVPEFFQNKLLYRIRYEIWQWKAYQLAKTLSKTIRLDVVHHVTIAAWWNCGHLWKLKTPFIFGPISGAQQAPKVAYSFLRLEDRIYEYARSLLFSLAFGMWQRPRRAIKKAKVVLAANLETETKIKEIRKNNYVIQFSEIGVNSVIEKNKAASSATPSIGLLWSGLLIPIKNFGLLLEALSGLPANIRWSLRVAGEGKLLNYWKDNVEQYGLARHISFLGRIDYSKMKEQYQWADAFVFPSLREATGTVVMEAMSYGLPVVAFDIHGASIVLDNSCGILIPIITKEQMVKDFSDAIVKLYNNLELRKKMGEAGRRKVEENYLWEKRGKKMNEIYREIACTNNVKSFE